MNKLIRKCLSYVNRETISYVIIGVLTTILYFAVYFLFVIFVFRIDTTAARLTATQNFQVIATTVIAWTVSVIFAFITNKIIVFRSKARDAATVSREFISFVLGRLTTLGFTVVCTWFFVTLLGFHSKLDQFLVQAFNNVVVIVANYIFSKLFIFKQKPSADESKNNEKEATEIDRESE